MGTRTRISRWSSGLHARMNTQTETMTNTYSRMYLPDDMVNEIKKFLTRPPYHVPRDPKSHKTHKLLMKQIKWLYEDIVKNDYIQKQKGFYKLMVYRVNNFEWIWSAFSDKGFTEGFDPLDAHRMVGTRGGWL